MPETLCPACGDIVADKVCPTCGARLRPSRDEIREAAQELVDEYFDDGGHSPASLDALADDAAERYYRTDFDLHDGFPYPR